MSAEIIKPITALIQENRFDEAKAIIKRVAAENVYDAQLFIELAKLEFLMGEFSPAKQYLQTSINLDIKNYEPHYQLGLIALKEGAAERAMPYFRQACELKSDFALGHFYWGLALYQMEKFSGALGQFKASIKMEKSLYIAMYYAGLTNQRLNENQEAQKDFNAAIATESDFAPAYNALGTVLLQLGKMPDATAAFEKACQLNPDFAVAHFNAAVLLALSNDFQQAQQHYRAALDGPEISAYQRALICNNQGIMFIQMNQWEMAYEYLVQAKEIAPKMVEAQINLGLVQIGLQEYDLALSTFEQTLKEFSGNKDANYYAGIALLCLRRYKLAQDRLAAITPHNHQVAFWLGWAYLAGQNYELARKQFENIAVSKEANKRLLALAIDAIGLCCALTGRHDHAITHFSQSIEIDPDLALTHVHRARSHEALKQIESAQKDYAQALKLDPECLNPDKDQISQLLKDSKFEEALVHATKIVSLQPEDIKSQLLLARALKEKGANSEALSLLSSIVVQAPQNAEAYSILGQIQMAQGNMAQADEIFAQGSKFPEVESELFLFWGKALNNLGLNELALEKFKEASNINPYDAEVYENWGQTLKSLNRFDEATEIYKVAASYL